MIYRSDDFDMYYGASRQLIELARELRVNETEAEKLLWLRINKKQLNGLRFRRQHPILYFIADFFCPKVKLVIELDGGIHKKSSQYKYDRGRDSELAAYGIQVLRFTNDEVMDDIESVMERITDATKSRS